MQYSNSIQPLLRLGACLQQLGLHSGAQELYDSLAAAFGRKGVEQAALGRANVHLSLGEIEQARKLALPGSRREGPDQPRWIALVAETEVMEGRYAPAAELLDPIFALELDAATRIRASKTLAHAMARLPDPTLYSETLDRSIQSVAVQDRDIDPPALGYAALISGNTLRERGDIERALRSYELARDLLPAGQRRAQANYWHATLREGAALRREELAETARDTEAGPWGELGETQLELELLKKRALDAADTSPSGP